LLATTVLGCERRYRGRCDGVPDVSASIACLWTPPFGSKQLRRRLRLSARTIDELIRAIEKEGRSPRW
jgi:hypothetical protein